MSSDDSFSWILKQITEVAKTIGQARKELDGAMKGIMEQANLTQNIAPASPAQPPRAPVPQGAVVTHVVDPLVVAANYEGIDTKGKTREQIATELAIKLNSSRK